MTAPAIPTDCTRRDDFTAEDPRILAALATAVMGLWIPGPLLTAVVVVTAAVTLTWHWLFPGDDDLRR